MSDEVIEELRREMAALRARVLELEGTQRAAAAEPVELAAPVTRIDDARVSRRSLLGKAGVAAAGVAGAVVVGGALAAQPAAADLRPLNLEFPNEATSPTALSIRNFETSYAFGVQDIGSPAPRSGYISAYSRTRASGNNMPAFRGDAEASYAFFGTSQNVPAVFGTSTGSAGVQGNCTGSGPAGVIGTSTSSTGVWGLASGPGNGVFGQASTGKGVLGQATSGDGVRGTSTGGTGVFGQTTNGSGVVGQSTNGAGVAGGSSGSYGVHGASTSSQGVFGESTGSYGVKGQSSNTAGVFASSTGAAALEAHGGTYGAWLQGTKAALFLVPQPAAGKPTSGAHKRGEVLCDKNGVLWFCTTTGSPGTWKQVKLV